MFLFTSNDRLRIIANCFLPSNTATRSYVFNMIGKIVCRFPDPTFYFTLFD